MREIQQQSHTALRRFFERFRGQLRSTVFGVVNDETETEDIVQETLLQVWREARNYSAKLGHPRAWVVTIAKRRAIDRVRRRIAYSRAKERFELFVAHEPQAWLRDRVEADVCGGDMRNVLTEHMSRSPAFQREAVELAYFGGMTHQEIATATQTPLGTIKTRLELGMKKLIQSVLCGQKI